MRGCIAIQGCFLNLGGGNEGEEEIQTKKIQALPRLRLYTPGGVFYYDMYPIPIEIDGGNRNSRDDYDMVGQDS